MQPCRSNGICLGSESMLGPMPRSCKTLSMTSRHLGGQAPSTIHTTLANMQTPRAKICNASLGAENGSILSSATPLFLFSPLVKPWGWHRVYTWKSDSRLSSVRLGGVKKGFCYEQARGGFAIIRRPRARARGNPP